MQNKLTLFVFIICIFFNSCDSHKEKKVIVEKDSMRKILEEHDSIRIVKENPEFRNSIK